MDIDNELVGYLEKNIKNGNNKGRDIEIIKFYYGLKESPWPTLEETASRFSVGSRERIRQLLNSKFRDHVNETDIPSLHEFIKIMRSRDYWLLSEFEKEIISKDLVDRGTHVKGILNLLDDIGLSCGFEIHSPDLKQATRNSIESDKNSYLIKASDVKRVTKLLKQAQKLPGRCGVANLRYIERDLGDYYGLVSSLIESSPTSWVRVDGDDYWYIFENRDNTIINYSEKVFQAIDSCESSRLAATYRNALDGRTCRSPYPPTEIIEEYLRSSVYFVNSDTGLKFIGETTKLNNIEEDLVCFFGSNESSSFADLSRHLLRKGHGKPYVIKTTNFSPLVFVDKSQGRTHYKYSLISQNIAAPKAESSLNLYEEYLHRLRVLLDVGTDEKREQLSRKEQHILQEWLFKGKSHERCAICGRDFNVRTLVTAHKKPRSDCNDAERLDPYIVMPLCLMGCDYLYENMYIYIEGEQVKRGLEFQGARTEIGFIDELIGRKIDPKWVLGSKSYFRSPHKASQRLGS